MGCSQSNRNVVEGTSTKPEQPKVASPETFSNKVVVQEEVKNPEAVAEPIFDGKFHHDGINVQYLIQWVNDNGIGDEDSTHDVCKKVILPQTSRTKESFANLHVNSKFNFKEKRVSVVKQKATYFVSHAWSYCFREVLDAICRRLQESGVQPVDAYIWMDIFIVNQHIAATGNIPQEWWSEVFHSGIKTIGHTLLVLCSWQHAPILKRAWCIWEIFGTVANNISLEICLSAKEEVDFIQLLVSNFDGIATAFASMDASNAEAQDPYDRDMIMKAIAASTGGMVKVNQLVLDPLKTWLLDTGNKFRLEAGHSSPEIYGMYLNSMGRLNSRFGFFQEAMQEYEKAAGLYSAMEQTNETKSGLANTYHNKADLLEAMAQHEAALSFYTKSRNLWIQSQGLTPNVATSFHNAAWALNLLGRYPEAINYEQQSLAMRRSFFGDNHLHTMTSILRLADIERRVGNYVRAVELFREAVAYHISEKGKNHSSTITAMNNLALCLQELGLFKESLLLYQQCLQSLEREHKEPGLQIASIWHNLAKLNRELGEYEKSLALQKKSFDVFVSFLGDSNGSVAASLSNMGASYFLCGDLEQASKLQKRALEMRKKCLGASHPHVALCYIHLANVALAQGKYLDSDECVLKALEIQLATLSAEHTDVASSLLVQARIDLAFRTKHGKWRTDESSRVCKERLSKCLDIRVAAFPSSHPDVAEVYERLADWELLDGTEYSAQVHLKKAFAIRTNALGPGNRITLATKRRLAEL